MTSLPFNLSETNALIFDMDGTVTDNIPYHDQSWIAWAKNEGLNLSDQELLSLTYGTIGEITRRLFPGMTPEEQYQCGERKEALYRDAYRPHLAPLPGLESFLKWSREHQLSLAVATAGDTKNIDFTIDGLKLRSYFGALVGSEDVSHGKPHPEVYLTAAKKLEVPPEHCVAFEDSVAGTEAARRAGMKCIVVNQMVPREQFGDCSHVLAWIDDYRAFSSAISPRQSQGNSP